MDISAEIAAIQAASQGSELRQPLVGALNKLNSGALPAVTASDAGKILKVGANGWEVGEKSGYMPVPTDTMQITDNGTYDVTDYASANVHISGGGGSVLIPKTITQNGTYDPTDDNADGYSEVTVNVSGASSPYGTNEIDYIEFAGNSLNNVIDLPITANADFIYTIEFERLSGGASVNDIIGTNGNNTQFHLTIYSNKYYCGTGVAEYNFTESLDGKHTVILNKDNSVYFDGNAVLQNVSSASSNYFLRLGGRDGYYANAKIYRFKIESINSGNVVHDFIPCQILYNNSVVDTGFYDQINQIAYTKKSVGKIYINIT